MFKLVLIHACTIVGDAYVWDTVYWQVWCSSAIQYWAVALRSFKICLYDVSVSLVHRVWTLWHTRSYLWPWHRTLCLSTPHHWSYMWSLPIWCLGIWARKRMQGTCSVWLYIIMKLKNSGNWALQISHPAFVWISTYQWKPQKKSILLKSVLFRRQITRILISEVLVEWCTWQKIAFVRWVIGV